MTVQEAVSAAMSSEQMKAALEALEAASYDDAGGATVEVKVSMTGNLNGRKTPFSVTFRVGEPDDAD